MSYQQVMEAVAAAHGSLGADSGGITVVAVSKTMTVEDILTIYGMGHRDFGENRLEELETKVPMLPRDIRWHFVGAVQSRKAGRIKAHAHLVHSVDRPSLIRRLAEGDPSSPPVLLQVNIGREPQKSGVLPEDLNRLADQAIDAGLDVQGLMALPPIPEHPEESREYFRELARLRDELRARYPSIRELSMGMTADFGVAIEEGASIIRVGRAIFGPRKSTESE